MESSGWITANLFGATIEALVKSLKKEAEEFVMGHDRILKKKILVEYIKNIVGMAGVEVEVGIT